MHIKQQNLSVDFNGCQCHVVHNTSLAGAKAFNVETGFDVEDLLVDIYYWFAYSTKQKCKQAEYTNFRKQEYRNIIKHVSMRWLSLRKVSVTKRLIFF